MTKYPLISIVIVEYKDDTYLSSLLSSIEKLDYPKSSLEIIIVTILSTHKQIKAKKITVKQIPVFRKMGYAEAENIGISNSHGEYIFSPNPDTIVDKTALTKMARYIRDHDDVGIVGPRVFSMDNPAKISPFDLPCKNFDKTTGKIVQVTAKQIAVITRPQELYWLCGNGIVVRKKVWEQVGKYDESYFLYWEDADFNMKVRDKRYKSVIISDAKLFHKGFASVGDTDDQVYYIVRNGRYFINKYSSFFGRCLLHLTNIFVIISKSLQVFFGTNDRMKTKAFIEGILDFYRGKRGMR